MTPTPSSRRARSRPVARLRREAARLDWRGAARGARCAARIAAPRCSSASTAATRRSPRSCASSPGPRLMAYRVNAGPLPADHWTNDLARGGGRLKGEGCHFIDFLCDQAGADPPAVSARGFRLRPACRWRPPTTSASRSRSPTGASAPSPTRPTRPRPRQGALRDERPRRLRRDRRLPARLDLARAQPTPARRRHQDKGFARAVRDDLGVLRGEAEAPPPDRFCSRPGDARRGALAETGGPERITDASASRSRRRTRPRLDVSLQPRC